MNYRSNGAGTADEHEQPNCRSSVGRATSAGERALPSVVRPLRRSGFGAGALARVSVGAAALPAAPLRADDWTRRRLEQRASRNGPAVPWAVPRRRAVWVPRLSPVAGRARAWTADGRRRWRGRPGRAARGLPLQQAVPQLDVASSAV